MSGRLVSPYASPSVGCFVSVIPDFYRGLDVIVDVRFHDAASENDTLKTIMVYNRGSSSITHLRCSSFFIALQISIVA